MEREHRLIGIIPEIGIPCFAAGVGTLLLWPSLSMRAVALLAMQRKLNAHECSDGDVLGFGRQSLADIERFLLLPLQFCQIELLSGKMEVPN